MKTVILVWKNGSIHRNKHCDDIYQLIKSTCYVYHLSTIIPFTFFVDTQHHSISNYIPSMPHPYEQLILNNQIPIVHDVEEYINTTSNVLFFSTTTCLPFIISEKGKQFIQQLFIPPYPIIVKLIPISIQSIVHVHINNSIISYPSYPYLFYKIYEYIQPYLSLSTIVLSDTKEFKDFLKPKNKCIIFDTLIGNIGYTPHDDKIEDTLFDLTLMTKATKIYSFSWNKKVPGFVKIASFYDVPIKEIKYLNKY
jgi:hypothetical protein